MGDIAYTVKPTGSLSKHSGDYINDALDSGGSLLYKVFINILENIAIIAHILKLKPNDGLDGVGSGLRVGFKAERSSGDGFKVWPGKLRFPLVLGVAFHKARLG